MKRYLVRIYDACGRQWRFGVEASCLKQASRQTSQLLEMIDWSAFEITQPEQQSYYYWTRYIH